MNMGDGEEDVKSIYHISIVMQRGKEPGHYSNRSAGEVSFYATGDAPMDAILNEVGASIMRLEQAASLTAPDKAPDIEAAFEQATKER